MHQFWHKFCQHWHSQYCHILSLLLRAIFIPSKCPLTKNIKAGQNWSVLALVHQFWHASIDMICYFGCALGKQPLSVLGTCQHWSSVPGALVMAHGSVDLFFFPHRTCTHLTLISCDVSWQHWPVLYPTLNVCQCWSNTTFYSSIDLFFTPCWMCISIDPTQCFMAVLTCSLPHTDHVSVLTSMQCFVVVLTCSSPHIEHASVLTSTWRFTPVLILTQWFTSVLTHSFCNAKTSQLWC